MTEMTCRYIRQKKKIKKATIIQTIYKSLRKQKYTLYVIMSYYLRFCSCIVGTWYTDSGQKYSYASSFPFIFHMKLHLKYYLIIVPQEGVTTLIRPCFHDRRGGLISERILCNVQVCVENQHHNNFNKRSTRK